MEPDPSVKAPDSSVKAAHSKGSAISHGASGKIPYPKHVWSPAGGWYSQPANWKSNTAIMFAVWFGVLAVTWKISAELEERPRFPEKGRFFPSRWWSRQIIEHERAMAQLEQQQQQEKPSQ